MGMFLNYQAIPENYTPNNTVCSFPVGRSYTKLNSVNKSKPFEEYNVKGELIGYSWRYGETLNLEFNIDGEVVVEADALIFTNINDAPDEHTEGYVGQRAYNVTSLRSWTCSVISDNTYIWLEDLVFDHDGAEASKSIYVSADDYLSDKSIRLDIFNFRMEIIHTCIYSGSSKIVFEIDSSITQKFNKGVYYCSLVVFDDKVSTPLFTTDDCTLLVK